MNNKVWLKDFLFTVYVIIIPLTIKIQIECETYFYGSV